MNRLYYGDNLDVLRDHIASDSIDLVYLDPPFNSNANYNILFKSPTGKAADSQIEAFEDSWHWNDKAEAAFHDVMTSGNTDVAELLRAMRGFLKENDMMAYLAMMAVRLIELHRVLKPTGSLYLHCDPTASHYLKLLLDGVFGPQQFLNEITWKRTFAHGSARRYGPVHDTIFFYSKNGHNRWQDLKVGHDDSYVSRHFRYIDEVRNEPFQAISLTGAGTRKGESGQPWKGTDPTKVGRHWAIPRAIVEKEALDVSGTMASLDALDVAGRIYWPSKEGGTPRLKWFVSDLDGARLGDVWTDIPPISAQAKERLGYPTQKPLALLERIIAASSNPGDVVLDPFCGCGTAIDAAQKLGRQWIGIDVTHLAIGLIERRMQDRYGPNRAKKIAAMSAHERFLDRVNDSGAKFVVVDRSKETGPVAKFEGLAEAIAEDEKTALRYEVVGTPNDIASAEKLAADEPHQFQYWITQAIDGQPYQGGRKGADRGIDGYVYFTGHPDEKGIRKTEAAIISVKAGRNVGVAMVRDLKGVVEREKAPIGIFVCVIKPTREMEREAASAGVYEGADGRTYPRLQLYTVAEYFAGLRPKVPLLDRAAAYRKAARAETGKGNLAFDL